MDNDETFEPTFERCEGVKPEPRDPDPMAEFSAMYHYGKELRRVRLDRKYGIGVFEVLEEEAGRRAEAGDVSISTQSDEGWWE